MKMHVITNEKGEVIATAPAEPNEKFTVRIEPVSPKHKLHEAIEIPDHVRGAKDVDEFHANVRKHLPKLPKVRKPAKRRTAPRRARRR
jgi:hypothetical protein